MKVAGRTRARTPYTQQYIDRRGFAPLVGDLEDRMTRLELAPRGIRREQSILNVEIVAGGPPGPPGGSFPHLIISPTHTDTGGTPFTGAVLTYNGTIWTPAAASGGLFIADYLIDAAYTGLAGAIVTTVNGHQVRIYATIDGAFAHAASLAAGSSRSFLIAGGTYNEQVNRTPPNGANWAIKGISHEVVNWAATANGQTLFTHGVLAGGARIDVSGVHFNLSTFTSAFGFDGNSNYRGTVRDCRFTTGGAISSIGLRILLALELFIINCIFTGDGIGIGDSGSTPYTETHVEHCFFTSEIGMRIVASGMSIADCEFFCGTMDIRLSGAMIDFGLRDSMLLTGLDHDGGSNSLGSFIVADCNFEPGNGEVGLDFSGLVSNSEAITIVGNTFAGTGTGVGIRLDAQMLSGIVTDNTFRGFTSGNEISGTGGADLQGMHNSSDAGALADFGPVVGHTGGGVSPHNILDGGTAHLDTMLDGASRGSLIIGVSGSAGVPLWDELIAGPLGTVLQISTALGDPAWQYISGSAGGAHAILDGATHNDSRVQGVSRGSLIAGMTGTAGGILWDELPIGPTSAVLQSDGVDAAWQYLSGSAGGSGNATLINVLVQNAGSWGSIQPPQGVSGASVTTTPSTGIYRTVADANSVTQQGTVSLQEDADGFYVRHRQTTNGSNSGWGGAAGTGAHTLRQLPVVLFKWKIAYSGVASPEMRFYVCLTETDLSSMVNSDTPATSYIGIRFSESVTIGDVNFQFVCDDGGGAPTVVDSGIAVDQNVHFMRITANSATSVTVELMDNTMAVQASTTFTTAGGDQLPASTTFLHPMAAQQNRVAAQTNDVHNYYCHGVNKAA